MTTTRERKNNVAKQENVMGKSSLKVTDIMKLIQKAKSGELSTEELENQVQAQAAAEAARIEARAAEAEKGQSIGIMLETDPSILESVRKDVDTAMRRLGPTRGSQYVVCGKVCEDTGEQHTALFFKCNQAGGKAFLVNADGEQYRGGKKDIDSRAKKDRDTGGDED